MLLDKKHNKVFWNFRINLLLTKRLQIYEFFVLNPTKTTIRNELHLYSWGSNFLSQPLNGHFPSCFSTQFVMQWSWKTWSHFPNFATHSPVLFADRHWMHWSMMWCWQIAHFSISVSYAHVAIQKIFFTSNSFLGLFRGAWI